MKATMSSLTSFTGTICSCGNAAQTVSYQIKSVHKNCVTVCYLFDMGFGHGIMIKVLNFIESNARHECGLTLNYLSYKEGD